MSPVVASGFLHVTLRSGPEASSSSSQSGEHGVQRRTTLDFMGIAVAGSLNVAAPTASAIRPAVVTRLSTVAGLRDDEHSSRGHSAVQFSEQNQSLYAGLSVSITEMSCTDFQEAPDQ